MDIYIMRHGETAWNRAGKIQGSSDIELTETGKELAVLSGDGFLRDGILFDRIYTSPLSRAVETAGIIREKAMNPQAPEPSFFVDDRLREMCFGKYEGQVLREIKETDSNIVNCFSRPSAYIPDPTGESYEHLFLRIGSFLKEVLLPLEQEKELGRVLVLCHGTVIRAFLALIRETPLDEFWNVSQPNCSINQIRLEHGQFSCLRERILYYDAPEFLNRGIL